MELEASINSVKVDLEASIDQVKLDLEETIETVKNGLEQNLVDLGTMIENNENSILDTSNRVDVSFQKISISKQTFKIVFVFFRFWKTLSTLKSSFQPYAKLVQMSTTMSILDKQSPLLRTLPTLAMAWNQVQESLLVLCLESMHFLYQQRHIMKEL